MAAEEEVTEAAKAVKEAESPSRSDGGAGGVASETRSMGRRDSQGAPSSPTSLCCHPRPT